MSSIEKSGFLSKEISEWINKHRAEKFEYFKLCDDLNDFAHSVMLKMTIHSKDLVNLIVASLYMRAMSNFQGTIIMAERGMINEVKSLLHCLIESMFTVVAIEVVAIEKDTSVVKQLVMEDLIQSREYLKAHKRNVAAGIAQWEGAPSKEEVDSLLQKNENEIKNHNVKKLTKRDLAEKAEKITTYDTAYKLLSGSIHVNVRDLEQYLELNESGEVQRILWGPNAREIDFMLYTAAETMMEVLSAIGGLFNLTYNESWKTILETHKKLGVIFN